MTDEQRQMIERLARCRFGVGSFAKAFVTDLHWQAKHTPDKVLTPRQDWYLRRLYYNYRRQLRQPHMPKPADYHTPPPDKRTDPLVAREARGEIIVCRQPAGADRKRAEELERLKNWNEGKPR